MRSLFGLVVLISSSLLPQLLRAEAPEKTNSIGDKLRQAEKWPGVIRSNLGVTRKGTRIPCLYSKEDLDPHSKKVRVLLVAGFQNKEDTSEAIELLERFYTNEDAKPFRKTFSLSAVPLVNPDEVDPPAFPVKGDAYFSKDNPEAEYLWRWIGMHGPDLVVISSKTDDLAERLMKELWSYPPCRMGTIPAITMDSIETKRLRLLEGLQDQPKFPVYSKARKELQKRVDREPLKIAEQLAKVYGHDLSSVQYIPALALVGRLWLGELTKDPAHRKDVERIVAPYVSGEKKTLPKRFGGSHLAGHLIFAELARTAEKPAEKQRYLELAQIAADTGFDESGQARPAMPAHNEMSDAVFMACPILVETGVRTGESKYLKMAGRHFAFMQKLVLRPDGIYRHSPLCETAWGRGNGFPALGLAWSLSTLPEDHSLFPKFRQAFQKHMAALKKHQDPTGMWHQVVDDDGSYRELSSTCMITFSLIRGVRKGWLKEADYRPVIEKAFRAIKTRIAADGTLVDVCTGTGKQKSLRDYYDRKAILGKDARGGAMALLVTTEMARWQAESK